MVELHPRCLAASSFGRFAKVMSFLVKHSSAAEGEDTRMTGREPNLMYTTGPYLPDNFASVLCRGFLKR